MGNSKNYKIANPSKVGEKEFIALMAVLMSIVAISIDAMLPALGIIGNDLNVEHVNQPQHIISVIFAGMAIGQLISGPLSDAIGRKKILFYCMIFYLLGSVICFNAPSLEIMLVGRFIQGLGASGPYVSTMSIVRDKYSGAGMARIMSLVMMIFIMTPALAPSLGQGILFAASWRYIFLFYVFYAVTVLAWVTFRLEETLSEENRVPYKAVNLYHGLCAVIGNKATVCYTLGMGLMFSSMMGYINSSRQIFQEIFNTGEMFVLYFGGLALTFGVASLLNSNLVMKYGMRTISRRAMTANMIASALFLILLLNIDIKFWMFLTFASFMFFNLGFIFGNLNALAMEPMGHIAGIASAIIGSISFIISIIGGTIIGQYYDGSLLPVISGFLIAFMLTLVLFVIANRSVEIPSEQNS
ncbi:MAG: multidrug effflux MFS transporter [Emcibacteraceae bacterium]